MMRLHDDRAVLWPEGSTTRPYTDLYLSGDFILMCLRNTVKTKENQFLSFSRKIRPCWEKIPLPLIAWYDDTQSYKIRSLRLHKQKNERETQVFYTNRTSLLQNNWQIWVRSIFTLVSVNRGCRNQFSVVRNVNRVWFSLACFPC